MLRLEVQVKRDQSAAQLWSLLAFAARAQHILSYKTIEQLTGIPKQAQAWPLGSVQDYCNDRKFPPLTAIVVAEETGLPGKGFTEATGITDDKVCAAQARVFVFNWLEVGPLTAPEK
jgi:hypothetical protein